MAIKQDEQTSKKVNFLRKSITVKVAAALFIAIFIVFAIAGLIIHNYTQSLLVDNVEEKIAMSSDSIAEQIDNLFYEKAIIVEQMETNQEMVKFLNSTDSRDDVEDSEYYEGVSEALDAIAETNPSIAMTWIASNRSNFLIGSNDVLSDPSFNIEDRPWYEQAMVEDEVYFTEPYMDEVFGEIILSAMTPIEENGNIIGIVAVDILLDELPNMMQSFALGDTGYSFLVTEDGTMMYHPDESYILEQQVQHIEGDMGLIGESMVAGDRGLQLAQVDNTKEYIGYSPVPTTDWAIASSLSEEEALNEMSSFTTTMMILLSVTCLILIVAVVLLLRYLLKDIPRITKVMNELGLGNLNVENIQTKSQDEVGQLVTSINLMQSRMREVVGKMATVSQTVSNKSEHLTQSANDVRTGSEQVATTMQELASGAENQANTTNELSSSMATFVEKSDEARQNSDIVYDSSMVVLSRTEEGSAIMKRSTEQMEKIDAVIYNSVQKVNNLETHTQEISQLVSVIKDISDQTNLLALNASIEAARAGESGKGFAVVANEVGKLAEQVASSITGITKIVDSIQQEMSQVTQTLSDGYKEVEQGSEQIKVTRSTFEQISESVNETVEEIKTVSNNLAAVSTESEKMNASIQEIAAISEESAAGVEETSASSEEITSSMEEVALSSDELSKLAEELNTLIQRFKL